MKRIEDWQSHFWTKVDKSGECWLWMASRTRHGYGQFGRHDPRRLQLAHRTAWEITYGAIPKGLLVCHRCDTPACVRPDHLFLGSMADNMRDSAAKGRHPSLKGTAHMPRGKQHHFYLRGRKITRITAMEIRRATGTNTEVGARFNVSASLVSLIRAGKIWRE